MTRVYIPKTGNCRVCGAPRGQKVVRLKIDRKKWALDTDLATEYPEQWAKPRTVRFHSVTGICLSCEGLEI